MHVLVGRKSDHIIVEIGSKESTYSNAEYKANIAANYGGVASDYDLFEINTNTYERINQGDEYTVIWSGNTITGVDFSIENNRKLLIVKTVNPNNKSNVKDTIIGNNLDSIIIQTQTCLFDKTLDASVNAEILLPIIFPDERLVYLKITITNGVGNEITLKTKAEGIWRVALGKIMVGTEKMRIWGVNDKDSSKLVNVLLDM